MNMNMNMNLNLTQEQRLIMTQQMQLSIKLLQMSNYDLKEYIEKEYTENPVLEATFSEKTEEVKEQDRIDYNEMVKYLEFDNYGSQSYGNYNNDDETVSPFNFIANKKSLKEYLHEQVLELKEDEYKKLIANYIIENLNDRGYLDIGLNEIIKELNISTNLAEEVLEIVQSLDPVGIGARDLKECLTIQLLEQGLLDENLEEIIENHLEDIAENRYAQMGKKIGISPLEAQNYGDIIKGLEPKPSRGFYTGEDVKFIVPDATIRKFNNEYIIIMNDSMIPKLSINNIYKEVLNNSNDEFANEYVKEKINNAMFLIKSIESRKGTLYRVLEKILEKQRAYFDKGKEYLKPMTLKEIAEELEMHESTISRAIRDKFVLTSMGTIKIKDMFVTGIVSKNGTEDIAVTKIKNRIKQIINEEDKKKPLSDQKICDMLVGEKITISRRTVAKYREELGIKSTSKRKRI